jgi:glutamate dehydrogenase
VVNRTGATFVNFIAAEAGATAADVVRAFTLAREIFDLEPLWDQIDALDYKVDAKLQLDLLSKLDPPSPSAPRAGCCAPAPTTPTCQPDQRYQPAARELRAIWATGCPARPSQLAAATDALVQGRCRAPALAQDLTALEFIFPALDLVDLAQAPAPAWNRRHGPTSALRPNWA